MTVAAALWTPVQAAEFLGLRPKTVARMAARGVLPAVKLGKHWRFDEVTLRQWSRDKAKENLKPCPSVNGPIHRIGRFDSRSLASKLDARLTQQTSRPRRNWRESSVVISRTSSEPAVAPSTPGTTPSSGANSKMPG
ncbi:MAG: helix-turn-helix domain-containing protein [Proteobacteria bacterium]|nr:helix-turn-helix domain-containing protein [Pseudomonadota bacterium]